MLLCVILEGGLPGSITVFSWWHRCTYVDNKHDPKGKSALGFVPKGRVCHWLAVPMFCMNAFILFETGLLQCNVVAESVVPAQWRMQQGHLNLDGNALVVHLFCWGSEQWGTPSPNPRLYQQVPYNQSQNCTV